MNSNKTLDYSLSLKITAYYQYPIEKIQINYGTNTPEYIDLSTYPKSKKSIFCYFPKILLNFFSIDLINYFGYSPKNLNLSATYPQLSADTSSQWIVLPRTEFRLDAKINAIEVYGLKSGSAQLGVEKLNNLINVLLN